MTTTTITTHTDPTNKRDRERFAALSPWGQDVARSVVGRMYDGTRTVAQCWKLALDAAETEVQ